MCSVQNYKNATNPRVNSRSLPLVTVSLFSMVPLLDLKAQYQALKADLDSALIRVAESQACILGPEVSALETELAQYLDVKHAIGVSSGTDALLMAFMALGIGPGDEVIVPDFSFFATAGCVSRLGATPVFVDVEPLGFMMDPLAVERAITSRTKAIVPVHLFGQAANMDALMSLASARGIPVIEDAAQAIGTQTHTGKRVGSLGQMGCFSFYPTKNLGAFGDAGLITTNDDALASHLLQLRNHGMEPRYYHAFIGGNFRIDAMQAAVLRVKLPYLPQWHAARRANAALYNELFTQAGVVSSDVDTIPDGKVVLPTMLNERTSADHHIFNQYTIRVAKRDALRTYLQQNGIGTEVYYPVPFHEQQCFVNLKNNATDFPVTNSLCNTVLALPIFPELSQTQIAEVVETVTTFLRTTASS